MSGPAVIAGPPNSGRTGAVLERFEAVIERDPIMVVPTRDDIDRIERELCSRAGGGLGGTVTSFPGLFAEVGRACGSGTATPLTQIQRIWLARTAARRTPLRLLSRSAVRSGFAPTLAELLSDLQAAGLDAASLRARIAELEGPHPYEGEVADLFAAYEVLRDDLGASDVHLDAAAATTALRSHPERWRERPVLIYGFDDLLREQVELVAALAEAAEVTVAITYEDRPALAARAELLGVLTEELGGELVARLEADPANTPSSTLHHLERNLFQASPQTIEPEGGLALLQAAGERGQAEMIGRHVGAAIASGVDPDEIAVVVRSPDREAPKIARMLASLGVPAAAEAAIEVGQTATGTALRRLLGIAAGEGTAADVVAFMRGPARAHPATVDWLERRVLRGRMRTATEALELLADADRAPWALAALAEAGSGPAALAEAVARIAADLAERPHLRDGLVPSGDTSLELRAAAEISRAAGEAAALGDAAPGPEEIAELLGHVRVPLWQGPTEGRVRILSPYRLRASRVRELYVAGLIDGNFPSATSPEPLLGDERRRALGIPARRDATDEERYLFYSCISRPERHLSLCFPATDSNGAANARSPFVDEVRALLDPPPHPDPASDPLEQELSEIGDLTEVAPPPERASSPRDLSRALALLPAALTVERARALELPGGTIDAALAEVAGARAQIEAARRPGPLRADTVLDSLGATALFGASTLEAYDLCSYRWFVDHELRPQRIDPDPEAMENGSVVHEVLERLYREPPGGGAPGRRRPTPETAPDWSRRARELLDEVCEEKEWELEAPRSQITLTRLGAILDRYLRRDAETGGPMEPSPELLEAAFGPGAHDDFPPAEIGSFQLHGKIDRIDVSADGKALIRDYKLSKKVVAGKKLIEEGKLQLPLYMLAAAGMGLEPIGGVYHPLAATKEDRPRGLLAADHKDALIPGATEAHVRTDFVADEELEELIDAGRARAEEIVAGIRGGRIDRNPRGGECPTWCAMAPICRMERSVVTDPDEEEPEG